MAEQTKSDAVRSYWIAHMMSSPPKTRRGTGAPGRRKVGTGTSCRHILRDKIRECRAAHSRDRRSAVSKTRTCEQCGGPLAKGVFGFVYRPEVFCSSKCRVEWFAKFYPEEAEPLKGRVGEFRTRAQDEE